MYVFVYSDYSPAHSPSCPRFASFIVLQMEARGHCAVPSVPSVSRLHGEAVMADMLCLIAPVCVFMFCVVFSQQLRVVQG